MCIRDRYETYLFFIIYDRIKNTNLKEGEYMSEQTSDEKYLLQSVNNALAIIDVLCEHDNLGLAEDVYKRQVRPRL